MNKIKEKYKLLNEDTVVEYLDILEENTFRIVVYHFMDTKSESQSYDRSLSFMFVCDLHMSIVHKRGALLVSLFAQFVSLC